MQTTAVEDVLKFWFPILPDGDLTAIVRQWEWWFRGGGDAEIVARFSRLLERAIRGELDDWDREPRSRLALILILDQFSRTIYRGTERAFAQDEKARNLTLSGIELGHYTALATPWEKTFFFLPLGHAEQLPHLELSVQLADALVDESKPQYHSRSVATGESLLKFSAAQARRHRDVVAQFGRQPHRNELLGRISTPAELEYLASGQLVHKQPFPPDLAQFLIRH